MENMGKVLKAAGSGLEHVVKTNVFLSDLPNDFAPMNEVYFTVRRLLPLRRVLD